VINGGYVPPYAAVAIFVAAVCEGLALSRQQVDSNGTENRLVMLWNIAHGMAVLLSLQAFTVMANTSPPAGEERGLLGAALLMVGLVLRTAAIRTLGEHFADGFEPSAARRVIAGPYRYIRHPAEFGLLLIIAGFGTLVCGWSVLPVALFAALTVVSMIRVIMEEIALQGISENEPAAQVGRLFSDDLVGRYTARSPFRIANVVKAKEPISAYMGHAYQ